jgi:hypothetical protein
MGGRAGEANEENPLVFADPATGDCFHFVNNKVRGNLYGLLSTPASLFMSDMAWTGKLSSAVNGVAANEAGVIYRITTVPEPGGWLVIVVFWLLPLVLRPRRLTQTASDCHDD